MDFELLKEDNCVQIESIHTDPYRRCVRGIIVSSSNDYVVLVTDVGTTIEIEKTHIMSVSAIEFSGRVLEKLTALKEYYQEVYLLKKQLQQMNKKEPILSAELLDAAFLDKFNIIGAKNRLEETMPPELLDFKRNMYHYAVKFNANYNGEIEVIFKVTNEVTHMSAGTPDTAKLIKANAPQESTLIKKTFKTKKVNIIEEDAFNSTGSLYKVFRVFSIAIGVTDENFMKVRDELIQRLYELQK